MGQVTFGEQVTGWHVTGHVGGQVTGQVIGHVIEMDGWLVTWWERLSKQVKNEKCTLRKPKNVTTTTANAAVTTAPVDTAVTTTPAIATAITTPTDATAATVTFTAVTTTTAATATAPTAIPDTIDEENPFIESLAYDQLASLGAHLSTLSLHLSSDSHDSQDISTEVVVARQKTRKEAQDVKTFFLRENARWYCKYCEYVSYSVITWSIF